MKTTIAGLIPNTPLRASAGWFIPALVCLLSSGIYAAVDDWPATAANQGQELIAAFPAAEQVVTLACRPSVQVSLDENGEAVITPGMLLASHDFPLNMYTVDIMGPLTNMVYCEQIGQEVMAVVRELPTSNTCMTTLIVEDKLKPVLTCLNDTIPCNTDLQTLDYGMFIESVYDNCDDEPTVIYQYTITDLNCDPNGFAGYIDIIYTATDDYGNSSSCQERVYLEKYGLEEVEFPADTVLSCEDPNADPEVIGGPTINGEPISHFCELVAWKTDNVIPMCSGQTKIVRLWRVMDWCTGMQISDPQEILIVDTVPPEIDCPDDVTIGTSILLCSSIYTFPDPDVTDVCSDDALIELRFTLNTIPGIFVPGQQVQLGVGDHIVTVSATDDCNNTGTCQYTVTVEDDDDPSVACSNLVVSLNGTGMAFINADNGAFHASDNCGVVDRRIRRMDDNCDTPSNLEFGYEVKFCCEDVGQTVMVIFEAEDAAGNVSTCMIQVTVKDTDDPTALCRNTCVYVDENGSVTVPVDSIDNGSYDNCEIVDRFLSDSVFTCDDIGVNVIVLTVTDAQGNTGTCTANVEVKDSVPPVALCADITIELNAMGMVTISVIMIDAGSFDNCAIDTMFLSQYDFDCEDIGDNDVDLIVFDAAGNSDTCSATVTIEEMPPMVMCMDVTVYLDENGMVMITPDDVDGVSDDCSVPTREVIPNTFDCEDIGPNIVVLIATDNSGNTASCTATVTVVDSLAPICAVMDLTVVLDEDGEVTLPGNALDDGSTDNCEIVSITIDPDTFDCEDTEASVVVVQTVTDQSGNTSTCSALVTVIDTVAPICLTQDLTIQLDPNGVVSIPENAVDDGSTDNCGIEDIDLNMTGFDCDDVGTVVVIQTVTDFSGNTSTCTATITVEDNTSPECLTQDITVYLDMAGMVEIDSNGVDDGSNDACGIEMISVTPFSFDCDDVGMGVVVTQTVTDVNGNTSSCTATVTVLDTIAPICATMDITVEIGPGGFVTIPENGVDDGSTDNCGFVDISVEPDTFDCNSPAVVVVVQTVTDASGNISTCTANVTVEGGGEPQAVCMDVTIYVDNNGQAFLDPEDVDGGSFSFCGDIELMVDPSEFDCGDVGVNEAVLTVTDNAGGSDTCIALVTVLDTIPPECLTQDITIYLDINGQASITVNDIDIGTTDNCGIDTIFLSQMDFDCSDLGVNIIGKTAIDVNGNMAIDSPSVTVLDTLPPLCATQDITVQLNPDGTVMINAGDVDDGSSDNCGMVNLMVVPNLFTCDDLGPNVVVLTVSDNSGNSSSCTATVTVEDPGMLQASCQNLTIFLGPNGTVMIDPEDVDNGSGGGCSSGDLMFELTQTMFDCDDVGVNIVTLTVTDGMGNTATCTAMITVVDNTPPNLVCPANVSIDCDDPVNIEDLSPYGIPSASDNCPPVTIEEMVQDNRNDCGAGTIVRTFTATDPSGNTAQCMQTITVGNADPFNEDNITWPPATVNLSQCSSTDPGPGNQPVIEVTGCAQISVDYEDVVEMTVDNDPNTPCIEITRTWTVIDSCQLQQGTQNGIFMFVQMIILNDNVGPIFSMQSDITVNADTVTCMGSVTLVVTATDCGMATPITNDFNAGGGNASGMYPIGTTTVTFTSTDPCGNISTLEVDVTVIDPDPPTVMCNKIIRHMNEELEVPVLAEEFITFTPGSCTEMDDYLFSYSPTNPFDSLRLWGCQYAQSVEPVMIYTFDLNGMPFDTCRADLDFRDTSDLCGNGLTLTGEIFNELHVMVNGVAVLISEPSMPTAFTNVHGRYIYKDLDMGGTYTLSPFRDVLPKQGVSTLDLVAIQKHLLGIRPLDTPYKLIAADVNNSKSITSLDLVELRKLLLDIIPTFQKNTSWRFVSADYEFPDPQDPWMLPFAESLTLDSVDHHMTHQDFVGIKIGDVNNSAVHLQGDQVEVRSGQALVLSVEDQALRAGEEIALPVRVMEYEGLNGYQFALQFDPALAEFGGVSIPKGSFLDEEWFGFTHTADGVLTTLWHEPDARYMRAGDELFTLILRARQDVKVSELLSITEEYLRAEAYPEAAEVPVPVRLTVGGDIRTADFALFQNVPNPFTHGTIIPVQLPESGMVALEVYAADGRLVLTRRQWLEAGYHEFQVTVDELSRGGVYYYTVATDRFKGTRKMILMD